MQKPPTTSTPAPIKIGRITVTDESLELDPELAAAARHAAQDPRFGDSILAGILFVDDLDRAMARATMYLQEAVAAQDVDAAETWGSIMHALQDTARANGAALMKSWRPVLLARSKLAPDAAKVIDEGERAAEEAAAEGIAAERARLLAGRDVEHVSPFSALDRLTIDDPMPDEARAQLRLECLICGATRRPLYACGCSYLKVDTGRCDDNVAKVCEDCGDMLTSSGYDIDRERVIVKGPDATFDGTLRELFETHRELGASVLAVVPGRTVEIDNGLAGTLEVTRFILDGEAAHVDG